MDIASAAESPSPFDGIDLLSLPRRRLIHAFVAAGEKPFRAEQLFRWLHVRQVRSFAAMTDLPADLRLRLAAAQPLEVLTVGDARQSQLDGSHKLVLRTRAGRAIEAVVMQMAADADSAGSTVTECLSSQVGCRMACDFCATARIPDRANLSAGEIVEQVAIACRLLLEQGAGRGGVAGGETGPLQGRPHNLVFMGMGEPLDNLPALLDALEILCDPKGYDFSQRRITVSTAGLAKNLPRLVAAWPHINLAWSLTATTDEVRDRLMPVNKGVPIERMVQALRDLPPSPSRKITFEYALLRGVNDSEDDARRLGRMALHVGAHANLIPFNAWSGTHYQRPERTVIRRFADLVRQSGASVSLRESKGQDIGAACGQLAGAAPTPTV